MNQRLWIGLGVALIIGCCLLLLLLGRHESRTNLVGIPKQTEPVTSQSNAVAKETLPSNHIEFQGNNLLVSSNPSSKTTITAKPSSQPALPETSLPPLNVLDNCRVTIHNYHDRFGENPVGNNAEITAALRGNNPKQVNFIRDDAELRVNANGELIDAYGTPFFFHQLSANQMEIRSAGQDRKLFTFDDVVTR